MALTTGYCTISQHKIFVGYVSDACLLPFLVFLLSVLVMGTSDDQGSSLCRDQVKLQSEAVADKARMKELEARSEEADKKVLAAQTIYTLCCVACLSVLLFH